jgi:transcriptional antiterminator RfaH
MDGGSLRMKVTFAMQHWHAIYTQPHREVLVNQQLEDRGLEVYFPALQFDRGYGRGIRLEPFFPHYLFVKVDLTSPQAYGLRWLPGIRTIVETDNQPLIIPDSVIQTLQERLDATTKRVLRKGDWLFQPGQVVQIKDGPFKGFDAVFQKGLSGSERVQILLTCMGSSVRLNVNVDQLVVPAGKLF